MTAYTPIANEKLRFAALNRHSLRRQGFGVLLSRLESVDSIFHSYTLMQVNFFCQGALVRKLSNNNNKKIYTRKTLCMPQDGHQGVLIVIVGEGPLVQEVLSLFTKVSQLRHFMLTRLHSTTKRV